MRVGFWLLGAALGWAACSSAPEPAPAAEPEPEVVAETEAEPAAEEEEPGPDWSAPQYAMDYGPFLSGTIAADYPEENITLKGIAIPLGEKGEAGMVFDTELLRMSAGWVDGYLELRGTPYDGSHGPMPSVRGTQVFGTGVGPGWAVGDAGFDDPRAIPHGPLPREVGKYRGLYRHGDDTVLSYMVDDCEILESPGVVRDGGETALLRTIHIGPHSRPLRLLLAEEQGGTSERGTDSLAAWKHEAVLLGPTGESPRMATFAGLVKAIPALTSGAGWYELNRGRIVLGLAPSESSLRVQVLVWRGPQSRLGAVPRVEWGVPPKLTRLTRGGPARWTTPVTTAGIRAPDDGAYVVDTLTVPYDNPWNSRMRIAALDFFSDGRAAVSTWNGDVWTIDGLDDDLDVLQWKRFATGLFDPLGLKIVDDVVHTLGRDQITKLHDLNGDGEADFYECFNNDVLITKNFHEFAFDLQTDAEGNFYFSKGGPVKPGGRGFDKIVPHHGCILKVSKDGSKLDVFATGLRAPNGIGVGPEGQVTSGDNEGTWTPRCRLNWIREGTFCGVIDLAQRKPVPSIYDPPVCWMPMEVDNSGGGQVWVTSDQWGPFQGDLLHLSYGTCSLFKVLLQEVDGVMQGGVARFPLTFASSAMRARFHPLDRQLYLCGLQGWQTSAAQLSAVHRIRYTGQPVRMPKELEVFANGIALTFTDALDRELAEDVESYDIEQWNYLWTERYGSPEVSLSYDESVAKVSEDDWNEHKTHDPVTVRAARLSDDGRTVFLEIANLSPVMQMRIRYDLDAADGEAVRGEVVHSIHRVPSASGPGAR